MRYVDQREREREKERGKLRYPLLEPDLHDVDVGSVIQHFVLCLVVNVVVDVRAAGEWKWNPGDWSLTGDLEPAGTGLFDLSLDLTGLFAVVGASEQFSCL